MVFGGIKVEGLNADVRALLALGLEVTDLKGVFGTIAAQGAELASSFAPVQTGRLARSVRGSKAKNKAIVLAGKKATSYAGAINYGWPDRGIEASEFMQRADDVMQPVALEELELEIDKAIRRRGLG